MLQPLENQQWGGQNKKLFLILLVYFAINISIKWLDSDPAAHSTAIRKLNGSLPLALDHLLQLIDYEQTYEGAWLTASPTSLLNSSHGLFELRLLRLIETRNNSYFQLYLRVFDGAYADDGVLELQFRCAKADFQTVVINQTQQLLTLKNQSLADGRYSQDQLLRTIEAGSLNASSLSFRVTVQEDSELRIGVEVETKKVDLKLELSEGNGQLGKAVVLAVVMMVACLGTFSGVFAMLREASEGGAGRFSLVTVCLTSMWDTVVCMVLLVLAFSSQINLMLFIVPAFLMCLVFTNLEPKLMILIFEAAAVEARTTQGMLCRFNMMHYGSLFLVYPIVLLANFKPVFFLLATCILFPQIYLNALTGTRPDPASRFYRHFLLYRFLLLFYVRCFPYNIFRFRPDYPLGLSCLLLLGLQYALLYLQKLYGPKKVVPRFMLPPTYEYAYDCEFNVEEDTLAAECAICLTPLHSDPPQGTVSRETSSRVMRTPCLHRYHSACLIEWMAIKQSCPECRAQLPPHE